MNQRALSIKGFFVSACIFTAVCVAISNENIYINRTISVPLGFYRMDKKSFFTPCVGNTVLIYKNKLNGIEQYRVNANTLLKIILAVPGDTVTKQGNKVFINGKEAQGMEIFEKDAVGRKIKRTMHYPCTIPEGYYFVGSFCREGYDSRYWGLCPASAIKGKVKLIYEFKH